MLGFQIGVLTDLKTRNRHARAIGAIEQFSNMAALLEVEFRRPAVFNNRCHAFTNPPCTGAQRQPIPAALPHKKTEKTLEITISAMASPHSVPFPLPYRQK
jgi:hypothetical protein